MEILGDDTIEAIDELDGEEIAYIRSILVADGPDKLRTLLNLLNGGGLLQCDEILEQTNCKLVYLTQAMGGQHDGRRLRATLEFDPVSCTPTSWRFKNVSGDTSGDYPADYF